VVDKLTGPSGECQGAVAYAPGATVTSKLGDSECNGPGEFDGHLYTLTLAEQTNLLVTVTPSGFSGAMGLWAADGKTIFQAVSAAKEAVRAKVFLPPGTYTLVAARRYSGGGTYTLTTQATTVDGCGPPFIWTVRGAVITGAVTSADCPGNAGIRWDGWEIKLAAGESITVSATVDQPAFVGVRPEGADGSGVSLNAGATGAYTFTAPSAANYIVWVVSDRVGVQSVGYRVTIQ
jgi:hypothetical protein